jgi:hypothetical protein
LVAYQDWRLDRSKRPAIGPGGGGAGKRPGGSKASGLGSSPTPEKGAKTSVTR